MAEAVASNVSSLPSIKPGQVYLMGRIDNVERMNSLFYTRLVLPAPDSFSHPGVVLVESKDRLGQAGDDLKVLCQVGGYRNDWKNKEGQDVKSARVTLKAL